MNIFREARKKRITILLNEEIRKITTKTYVSLMETVEKIKILSDLYDRAER